MWLTELRGLRHVNLGSPCDSLIKARLTYEIENHFVRCRLLRETSLSLTQATDNCRASEVCKVQIWALGKVHMSSFQKEKVRYEGNQNSN